MTQPGITYHLIQDNQQLVSLQALMRLSPSISLDTEADSLHNYFEKVCLIQISIGVENFVVDPLSGMDLTEFLDILSGKPLILHAADYDLRMLRLSYGFRAKAEIFDTMIASQLLGYEKVGLAALVEKFYGITLAKHAQKTDWSKRPLSKKQLHYAVEDSAYLEKIAGILITELRQLGREDWHKESCARMVQMSAQDKENDPQEAWRIKGSGLLKPKELIFVRELVNWRDQEARGANRPPFKILGNEEIFALAKQAAQQPPGADLKKLSVPHYLRGQRLEGLLAALMKAQETPEADWPKERERKFFPQVHNPVTVESLRAECVRLAATLGITPSTLASRSILEAIVAGRARTVSEMMEKSPILHWQAQLIEPLVGKIFNSTKVQAA